MKTKLLRKIRKRYKWCWYLGMWVIMPRIGCKMFDTAHDAVDYMGRNVIPQNKWLGLF